MQTRIKQLTGALLALVLALSLLPALSHAAAARPNDVAADRWSASYILAALDDATMTLAADGGFEPERAVTGVEAAAAVRTLTGTEPAGPSGEEPITRGQLAAMLYAYVESVGEGFRDHWMFRLDYADTDRIGEGQYAPLCWMTQRGVMNGLPDGTIASDAPLTREQLAAVLCRFREVMYLHFAACHVDYSDANNWAYCESGETDKTADVFFVCPTVVGGKPGAYQMALANESARASFLGATNMEKGIYDGSARFFAPYYRQIGLAAYTLEPEETQRYLRFAYEDVMGAFAYYLEHYNNGRPIILAGFSQGAELCIDLVRDFFDSVEMQKQLVACYAIGWRVTEEQTREYPQLRMAQGEDDLGVIVAFNSEAEGVDDSLMIPKGTKTLAINPLNWKTDGTPADRSLNLGACFTDYSGAITQEIPALTGAYLDGVRGALKVTDVTPEDYPPVLDLFAPGVYHLYDYQFFYRNLQKNVAVRLAAYLASND